MNNIDFSKLKPVNYNRKSSEAEDRQMLSIESQIDEANRTRDFYKLPAFVAVFKESKSAKKEYERPEFTRMIQMILKGKVDTIVCWKPDRLARNMTEGGQIIDLLSSGIIKAIITHDKVYYPWDNVIVLAVEFSQGKQFVKDLSINVKRGQTKKASIGIPHGVAALGFLNDKTEEKGNRKWYVDQERFPKIQILFKMFLTGTWSAGKLYRYAVEELKLTTVKHKKIGGSLIQRSRIYTILTDPIYAGFFFYGGNRYELSPDLPRIITEEEHNKIKILLSKRNIPKTQKHECVFAGFISSPEGEYIGPDYKYQLICDCNKKFAFRGKDKCPFCGSLIDEIQNPKYLNYTYYYNISKKKRHEKYKSISEKKVLEFLITEVIDKTAFSAELAQWSKKHVKEMRDEEINYNLFRENIAKSETETFIAKKKRRRELLADGLITEEEYKSDIAELEAYYKSKERPADFDWTERANEIIDTVQEFIEIMKTKANIQHKRAVLARLGSNLIWDEKKLSIYYSKPIQMFFNGLEEAKHENKQFEPKDCIIHKGSNDKTVVPPSILSTMLHTWHNVRKAILEEHQVK